MKNTILSLVLALLFVNATCQENHDITQIEASKTSRGYEEHITITPDSLSVYISNAIAGEKSSKVSRKLEPEDWTRLVETLSAVKLEQIPQFPSPTMKRASDAAKHSTIKVVTKGGKSYEHGFDDDDPHQALRPLLKTILELTSHPEKP